jgi:hypothetical protein
MANTFELISAVTVGSGGAASIDFSSIPSTYTDLVLVLSTRTSTGSIQGDCTITFNGSGSSYSQRIVYSSGSGTASITETAITYRADGSTATASTFDNTTVYIPNYAGSTYKSVSLDNVTENNATGAFAALGASLWSNTAAINQITVTPNGGATFSIYSTAYLYGVKNA